MVLGRGADLGDPNRRGPRRRRGARGPHHQRGGRPERPARLQRCRWRRAVVRPERSGVLILPGHRGPRWRWPHGGRLHPVERAHAGPSVARGRAAGRGRHRRGGRRGQPRHRGPARPGRARDRSWRRLAGPGLRATQGRRRAVDHHPALGVGQLWLRQPRLSHELHAGGRRRGPRRQARRRGGPDRLQRSDRRAEEPPHVAVGWLERRRQLRRRPAGRDRAGARQRRVAVRARHDPEVGSGGDRRERWWRPDRRGLRRGRPRRHRGGGG